MATTASLTEDFTTRDTSKWTWYGTSNVDSGVLNLVPTSGFSNSIASTSTFNMTGSSVTVKLVQPPNFGNGNTFTWFGIHSTVDSTDGEQFLWAGGNLIFKETVNGVGSETSTAYNASDHVWLRIREQSGTVFWETSNNRSVWYIHRSKTLGAIDITSVYVSLWAAYTGTEPNPGTAIWDDVNLPATTFSIPQPATVLTLNGLNFNLTDYVQNAFGGMFNNSPYTRVKVDYPASAAPDSISKGVTSLNNAVRNISGQKIVSAHSQGAEVCSVWIDQYADDGTAPGADELMFILFGNPRRVGGYGVGRITWDLSTVVATRTDTPWTVIDVARQYDGWPDWPADESNGLAVQNAISGQTSYHQSYDGVDMFDTDNAVATVGTTTYVLTQEDLPMLRVQSWLPADVVATIKRFIESAYNRLTG